MSVEINRATGHDVIVLCLVLPGAHLYDVSCEVCERASEGLQLNNENKLFACFTADKTSFIIEL